MKFSKILKAPLKVIALPVKGIQKGVKAVTNQVYIQIALAVLRHGLTFIGGAGALSNDEMTQIISVGATFVGLAWSGIRKVSAARKAKAAAIAQSNP